MIAFRRVVVRLQLLGIFDIRSSTSPIDLSINMGYRVIVMSLLLFVLLSSGWYMLFEAKTYNEFAQLAPVMAATIVGQAIYLTLHYDKFNIIQLMNGLKEFFGKRIDSRSIYEKANKKFENWLTIIAVMQVTIALPMYFLPNLIISCFRHFTSDGSNETFRLVAPATLPYDWQPMFIYLGTYFLQTLSLSLFTVIFYVIMFLHIGFCLYSLTFVSDLKFSLFEWNSDIVHVCGKPKSNTNSAKHKQKLCEIIRFHCDAEQFVAKFSKTFKKLTSISLLLLAAIVSGFLLLIDVSIKKKDLASFNSSADGFINFICWLFVLCLFGNKVTNRFVGLGDFVYDMDWYCYPCELQKCCQMLILVSQRPIYVQAFLNFNCSLDVFKMVVNKSYSVFMLFRRFNN